MRVKLLVIMILMLFNTRIDRRRSRKFGTLSIASSSSCTPPGTSGRICVSRLNDYTEAGDIKVVPISTKDNVADAMTKPLGKVLFLKHREALVKGG